MPNSTTGLINNDNIGLLHAAQTRYVRDLLTRHLPTTDGPTVYTDSDYDATDQALTILALTLAADYEQDPAIYTDLLDALDDNSFGLCPPLSDILDRLDLD